jgi:hypothetical protein
VGVGISEWVRESHIHGLVLSIPHAGDRASPLVISMSNLRYLYLTESNYSIKVSNSTLNKLFISCSSRAVNLFAKWLVHLKDLRIKTLVIDEPVDESLHIKHLMHMNIGRIFGILDREFLVKLIARVLK